MRDYYGREINYMRISVTDRCNLRCVYCMPEGGIECVPMADVLTFEEIVSVCQQAAGLGVSRVKITGGEPLVRRGVTQLIKMLKAIPGIEQITMTTNGCLLAEHMDELVASGLDGVNISIDSLDSERYRELTRVGNLEDALRGLEAAISSGLKVKVNTVLCPGDDWKQMIELARDNDVDVKFIETMPLGMGEKYSGAFKEDILAYMAEHGIALHKLDDHEGNGPAVYYRPEGFKGRVGIIAPIHGKFCDECNRIRLSATGQVKPCLCYGDTYDVKACVRGGKLEDISRVLEQAINSKPAAHRFDHKEYVTETGLMSRIGG